MRCVVQCVAIVALMIRIARVAPFCSRGTTTATTTRVAISALNYNNVKCLICAADAPIRFPYRACHSISSSSCNANSIGYSSSSGRSSNNIIGRSQFTIFAPRSSSSSADENPQRETRIRLLGKRRNNSNNSRSRSSESEKEATAPTEVATAAPLATTTTAAIEEGRVVRVAVLGGGAAGFFSAIECARRLRENLNSTSIRSEVVVLEASRAVLSKVLISGGGRCNVMHDPTKGADLIAQGYPRGGRELLGPLTAKFGPWETFDWFNSRLAAATTTTTAAAAAAVVTLKTERDGRVFPSSDSSASIVQVLQRAADDAGVVVHRGAKVTAVEATTTTAAAGSTEITAPRFVVHFTSNSSSSSRAADTTDTTAAITTADTAAAATAGVVSQSLQCDAVIAATGSSRLGFTLLQRLGHDVSSPLPSLFSFRLQQPQHAALTALSGISNAYTRVTLLLPPSTVTKSKTKSKTTTTAAAAADEGQQQQQQLPASLLRELSAQASRFASRGIASGGTNSPLSQCGALLVTQQGASGPAILKLSAFGAKVAAILDYKFQIQINFLGFLTAEELVDHFKEVQRLQPSRTIGKSFPHLPSEVVQFIAESMLASGASSSDADTSTTATTDDDDDEEATVATATASSSSGTSGTKQQQQLITRRLWRFLVQRAGVSSDARWAQLSQSQLLLLAQQTTAAVFDVSGRGSYRDEFVTCGGVKLNEVDFSTMGSKRCSGLFLCGEVLDVDGITGGYNFQSAWTTAFIAGSSCANALTTAALNTNNAHAAAVVVKDN